MAVGAAIGTAVGGIAQARAASKGADAQADAARDSNEIQKYIFDQNREDLAPYREAGNNALAALQYELGLGQRPTFGARDFDIDKVSPKRQTYEGDVRIKGGKIGFGVRDSDGNLVDDRYGSAGWAAGRIEDLRAREAARKDSYRVGGQSFGTRGEAETWAAENRGGTRYEGFKATPGYQFRREEGENALERMMAARGMRMGGAAMKEAMRFGDGLAAQEYGNFYNRLAGMAGIGQTATNTTAQLGQNYAANVGQNNMLAGQAKASGYAGVSNAINGTINGLGSVAGAAAGGYFGKTPQGWFG